jgi:23S rRNA pseudouridine2604 synthase
MQKIIVKETGRINKILADAGICSRREADKMITGGKIFDGRRKIELGERFEAGSEIIVKTGVKDVIEYALYFKPRGEITGVLPDYPNLHPVGRLDKESDGLMIYTNDYRVTEKLLNPKYENQKEYRVKIREKATPRVERILMEGIYTAEDEYKPAKKVTVDETGHIVHVTLIEGKKHEVRRMMNALNLTIDVLTRVRIMDFKIGRMRVGEMRMMTEAEVENLKQKLDII